MYVTNTASNSISVIDSLSSDEDESHLLVGLTLNIFSPNTGHIKCNTEDFELPPITYTKYIRLPYETHITCIPFSPMEYDFEYWGGDYTSHNSVNLVTIPFIDELILWFQGLHSNKEAQPIQILLDMSDTTLPANFNKGSQITDYLNIVLIPMIFLAAIPIIKWIYKKYGSILERKNYL